MAFPIPVTALYGTLNILFTTLLGINVSRTRGKFKAFLGDTPNPELLRTIRAHGNNTEWMPADILSQILQTEPA